MSALVSSSVYSLHILWNHLNIREAKNIVYPKIHKLCKGIKAPKCYLILIIIKIIYNV